MTYTFSPVFRPDALPPAELLAADDDAGVDAAGEEELDELEEQAASVTATGTARASNVARLSFILNPFNRRNVPVKVGSGPGSSGGDGLCGSSLLGPAEQACPVPEPAGGVRHEDAGEQERAGDDAGRLLVEIREQQRVLYPGEREDGEDHAGDGALAAED